jgi:hypothetical protein
VAFHPGTTSFSILAFPFPRLLARNDENSAEGSSMGEKIIRLAVDIGGTFTDIVLETGDVRTTLKVLTTHDSPEKAILEGT